MKVFQTFDTLCLFTLQKSDNHLVGKTLYDITKQEFGY